MKKRVTKWIKISLWVFAAFIVLVSGGLGFLYWKFNPKPNVYVPLETRWANQVHADNVLLEYPRPQMVRNDWQNLNGQWQFAIRPKEQDKPANFDGEILVPFAVESMLSGVQKRVGEENLLWYKRDFHYSTANNKRLLLHFGGVDWHTVVWVNGEKVGEHKGSHDPFSFDITDYLTTSGKQELLLSVWDPTDAGTQPRGKQVNKPQSIYYTPVTGIWQTVWLEPVPETAIEKLKIIPDIDNEKLMVTVQTNQTDSDGRVKLVAISAGEIVAKATGAAGQMIELSITNPNLWSPESPFLYDLQVDLIQGDETVDSVSSYFGMRKISVGKDQNGIFRLMLNNSPRFQLGLLDQGWWPDGLYTAPSDDAMRFDIEKTLEMGYNMIRKHVKVEPARWYYHCDKLGMLVWQDMPTGDKNAVAIGDILSIMISKKDFNLDAFVNATMEEGFNKIPDIVRTPESAEIYHRELEAMIDALQPFPSIVVWVPFNESWGQFQTNEVIAKVKQLDPSRIVDGTSGWIDRGKSDIRDYHIYNRKLVIPRLDENRTVVIGEFGGLGHSVEGHLAVEKAWSYQDFETKEILSSAYENLIRNELMPLIDEGLSGAVYTQTTDVESEINGMMTYDREVDKITPVKLNKLHQEVYSKMDMK